MPLFTSFLRFRIRPGSPYFRRFFSTTRGVFLSLYQSSHLPPPPTTPATVCFSVLDVVDLLNFLFSSIFPPYPRGGGGWEESPLTPAASPFLPLRTIKGTLSSPTIPGAGPIALCPGVTTVNFCVNGRHPGIAPERWIRISRTLRSLALVGQSLSSRDRDGPVDISYRRGVLIITLFSAPFFSLDQFLFHWSKKRDEPNYGSMGSSINQEIQTRDRTPDNDYEVHNIITGAMIQRCKYPVELIQSMDK